MKRLSFLPILALFLLLFTASARDLRVGLTATDISQLDPIKSTKTEDVVVMDAIYNGLVRFQPGNANPENIQPDLAESWDVSEDGLTWTFHLRRGVQFHKGYGELTADDVVFSLTRASDPSQSAFSSDYAAFSEITALDDYTVQIKLSGFVPSLLGLVANYHGGLVVSKAAVEALGDDYGLNPVGTGPFAVDEHRTQQYIRLEAFADHFRGTPKLDGIMYRFLADNQSRTLAFESGELDIAAARRDQLWVDQVRAMPNAIVDIFGIGETRLLHFNLTHEPLDNLLVRQAMAHAVNVEEIQMVLGLDIATEEPSPVAIGYMGHTSDVKRYPFDLERSAELLAEAGFPGGIDLGTVLITETDSLRVPMEILQAQFARANIKFELQVLDHATWHEQIRKDLSPLVIYGAARFPVASIYLQQFLAGPSSIGLPTAVTNFSHYGVEMPGIDDLLKVAENAGSDDATRIAAWEDAQRRVLEDLPVYPLYTLQLVLARKDNVDLGYEMESSMTLFYPFTSETSIR